MRPGQYRKKKTKTRGRGTETENGENEKNWKKREGGREREKDWKGEYKKKQKLKLKKLGKEIFRKGRERMGDKENTNKEEKQKKGTVNRNEREIIKKYTRKNLWQ